MKKERNFLDMVPVPSFKIGTIVENELAILTTPRFNKQWMAKLFLFGKKNEVRIKLDPNGTLVWSLIDGKKSVQEILDKLSEKTQEEENYEERTIKFMLQLLNLGIISC